MKTLDNSNLESLVEKLDNLSDDINFFDALEALGADLKQDLSNVFLADETHWKQSLSWLSK